jgi:gas vesicle protein
VLSSGYGMARLRLHPLSLVALGEAMRHRSSGGFVGFLTGLGIGAAAGLLLAPASGRDTRDHLRDAADDLSDRLGTAGRRFARSARDTMDQTRDRVRDAVSAGKRAYEDAARESREEGELHK